MGLVRKGEAILGRGWRVAGQRQDVGGEQALAQEQQEAGASWEQPAACAGVSLEDGFFSIEKWAPPYQTGEWVSQMYFVETERPPQKRMLCSR